MPQTADQLSDATLSLLLAPGLGPRTLARLRCALGDDDRIALASVSDLASVDGIGRTTADSLRRAIDDADTEHERDLMRERAVSLVAFGDSDYPALLATIPDPPTALWVQGTLPHPAPPCIAIVGSRKCTAYGREQAGRFASLLAQAGLVIVSGGALGIDSEAHRGALRAGKPTFAVLGCGLSHCYPQQNASLFREIVDTGGALISEFTMRTAPRATNFPRRNRIISGLAMGVLVVEASNRSGALITARLATEEHGREVMAVPGRVDSPASAGCLAAIRDGHASLVMNHADVLSVLESSERLLHSALDAVDIKPDAQPASLRDAGLTDDQKRLVQALEDAGDAVAIDDLAIQSGIALSQLMAEITLLEIRGMLRRQNHQVRLKRAPTRNR